MTMRKSIAAAVALLVTAFGASAANAQNTTIASGNTGSLVTIGTTVSNLTMSYSSTLNGTYGGLTTTSNPNVLGPASSGTQYAYAAKPRGGTLNAPHLPNPIAGSEWVSPYLFANGPNQYMPLSSAPVSGQSPAFSVPAGYYMYTETFTVGPGQTQFTLNGNFGADSGNVQKVLLNGQAISFNSTLSPAVTGTYYTGSFSGSVASVTGTQTLSFIVKNTNAGFTVLDFSATTVPEPSTVIVYVLAVLGIAGMALRARNRRTTMGLA